MIRSITIYAALIALLSIHTAFATTFTSFEQRLQLGQQQLQTGQVNMALDTLHNAYQQVQNNHSESARKQQASVMAALGEANVRAQNFSKAEQWLNKSNQIAQALSDAALSAAIFNRFGLLYATQNNPAQALTKYTKALAFAQQTSDTALIASSYVNVSKYQPAPTAQFLMQAYQLTQKLTDDSIKRQLLLAIGYQAQQKQKTLLANQTFREVLQLTPSTRQKAEALGYLGGLYLEQARNGEALALTRQAIVADNSPDLLIKWEQQQAQILQKKGETKQAIQAYRRAVAHIESIRRDIPIFYQDGTSSFRKTLAPVYVGLVDLLLQQNDDDSIQNEKDLKEVQTIWERFKTAELNDYFRKTCDINQSALNDWQENNSDIAIFYPILLPDRLELLLSINQKISRYRVDITADEISASVNNLFTSVMETIKGLQYGDNMRSNQLRPNHLNPNEQLYQWLIKPIAKELKNNNISTLIYIPDGVLRKIPLGILSDGQDYLIEHYAVVTNPGMSMLIEKEKSRIDDKDFLLTGMSIPGAVVEDYLDLNLQPGDKPLTKTQREKLVAELTDQLSLPMVDTELEMLSSMLNSPVMKNDQFTQINFEQAILKGQNIIHIASHGFFSGNPEQSYVMTYDQILNMNDLISLFQAEAFSDKPVDLISFSACETAEGDDRSPLGLSGVVVQAGVRSAIGTLWQVSDEAAQKVFTGFYQNYYTQDMTKAQALRKAQLALLKLPEFEHPVYWGGFILTGEWK
ncbi:MAG: CHAT domain-containing protein [Methylococcales bacterium]